MTGAAAKIMGAGCLIGAACAGAFSFYGARRAINAGKGFGEKDFLKTNGRSIVNRNGERVALRGVNLGGWLLQESWMSPNNGEDKKWGHHDTLRVLSERFGDYGAAQLIKTYEDNWITERDLDYLASLGVNCVRVPFWYRNLYETDSCKGEPDFSRLDWIVEECSLRRIYVILDLHGAPGFQSDDHCCGKVNSSILYDSSAKGARARELTLRVWCETARHFAGNPAVAAYDLLNEPMNGFGLKRKKDKTLWRVYDRIYNTVRREDSEHIITVEGVWDLWNLPSPKKFGWQNVVYQLHNYNWSTFEIKAKLLDARRHEKWCVPIMIGEFQAAGIWDFVLNSYNDAGFSWLTWTYKGAKCEGSNDWFMFSGNPAVADLQNDSYAEIAEKWGEALQTQKSFNENKALTETLSRHYARAAYPLPDESGDSPDFGCVPGKPVFRVKFGYHIVKGIT